MKTRIEEIIVDAVKAGLISTSEGCGIITSVMYTNNKLDDNGEEAGIFAREFGTFNVQNVQELAIEK